MKRACLRAPVVIFLLTAAAVLQGASVTPPPPLWSNGTVSQTIAGGNLCDGACGSQTGQVFTIFDNFTVTGPGWNVTGFDFSDFFVNNTQTSQYSTTQWSIWSGDPLHNGTLVTSGTAMAMLGTPNCNVGTPGACLVLMTVSGISVTLGAGTYWLGTGNVETGGATTYRALASGNGLPNFEQSNGHTTGVKGSNWIIGGTDATYFSADTAFDIIGTATPEPATLSLMGFAIAGLVLVARPRVGRKATT